MTNAPISREAPRGGRWRHTLSSRRDRALAWLDFLFADHGLLRLVYLNQHEVATGVWRAGQPTPGQIRAFARRGGRSVVSLRAGRAFGSLPLERDACRSAGIAWHNLVIRSRGLPSRDEFHTIAAFFRSIERPVLFHCKSGADRAGFAAALWLMLCEGRPAAEAQRQLSPKFGHIRLSKTGVLDAFFDSYRSDTEQTPMPLAEWVDTRYDPAAIQAAFSATPLGTLIRDRLTDRD